MPRLLNIGSGKAALPSTYRQWEVVTLDIDESVKPDLCMDARDLTTLEPGQYDAVWMSHALEHFCEADVDRVLWGCYHVLTYDGFVDLRVPDARAVMEAVVQNGLALDAVLYQAPVGPIRVCDVLWGWQAQIKRSGQDYYGHKIGFCRDTLGRALKTARFEYVTIGLEPYGLHALAFKRRPEATNG